MQIINNHVKQSGAYVPLSIIERNGTMFKIQTLNKISPSGMRQLGADKYTYGDDVENPDGIVLRSFSMHDMELPKSLLAVARAGAGTNNIPIDKCTEQGIVVFNTPGANANAVKELVIAALLLSSRKIVSGIEWAKTLKGNGDEVTKMVEKGKSAFVGPEIQGKTLGVIGLGAIGVMVANAANHLGMHVIGYDPYISIDAAWGLSHNVKKAQNLNEIFEESDYITLHVPFNSETKHMINSESIAMMQKGVRVLNFSRAALVNSEDMLAALDNGEVSCYITDFPTDDVLGHEKVVAIPHLGASTPESEENCAVMAAQELKEYLENGNIINSVNFPCVDLPRSTKGRVAIGHKNVPNMLSQISAAFANGSVNIMNMVNKSRKDLAYTIIEVEDTVKDSVVDAIKAIEGTIFVRVLK